jgi:hypothetical protein
MASCRLTLISDPPALNQRDEPRSAIKVSPLLRM